MMEQTISPTVTLTDCCVQWFFGFAGETLETLQMTAVELQKFASQVKQGGT